MPHIPPIEYFLSYFTDTNLFGVIIALVFGAVYPGPDRRQLRALMASTVFDIRFRFRKRRTVDHFENRGPGNLPARSEERERKGSNIRASGQRFQPAG